MTVSNQTRRIAAVGNAAIGQEVPFSFPYAATSDITVYSRVIATGVPTPLAETTNYTLTEPSDTGGTLTTVTAVAVTSEIHIIRDTPKTQSLDLEQGGSFSAEDIEDMGDKNCKLIIENEDSLDRAIRAPATDAVALDLKLPSSVDRASKNLGFDAGGNVTVTDSSGTFATAIAVWDDVIIKGPYADVRGRGATGDGVTDDTAAIVNTISAMTTAGVGTGAVYFPPGTYMFSNFTLPPNISLYGDHYGTSVLKRIAGSVGTAIEDADNAAKISIHDLQIHGNSCAGVLLKLGYNTTAWGVAGKLTNLWLREAPDYVLQVNGNVGFIETVACSGTGTNKAKCLIDGIANLVNRLTHVGASADYGIEIQCINSTFTHTHCEGIYTSAAINAKDDNIVLIATNITVPGGETLPTGIYIPSGQFGCIIHGLLVFGEAASTITSIIKDDAFSTGRTLLGLAGPTSLYRYLDYYVSSRSPYIFNTGAVGVPTTGEYWKGDFGILQETDEGEPDHFRCVTEGTPGTWVPVGICPGAIAKTADYSVLVASDNGKRFSNVGDDGTIVFSLPAATVGQTYHFIRIATQSLRVLPNGAQTIRGGGAGEYLQLDADGDNVTIQCMVAGSWEIISLKGTPSFA